MKVMSDLLVALKAEIPVVEASKEGLLSGGFISIENGMVDFLSNKECNDSCNSGCNKGCNSSCNTKCNTKCNTGCNTGCNTSCNSSCSKGTTGAFDGMSMLF